MLVQPPDAGITRLIAGRGIGHAFLTTVQAPLQHAFSFGVPNAAALEALAAHAPICEVGAGTGYWGRCLRERGVRCVLYDDAPPAHGSNPFHPTRFSHAAVDEGDGAAVAAARSGHTLLLVWPHSLAQLAAATSSTTADAASSGPWDVRALRAYAGDVIAHVGELEPHFGAKTTSAEFAAALRDGFELVQTVELPTWPHMRDALTIWRRRRSEATAAADDDGALPPIVT